MGLFLFMGWNVGGDGKRVHSHDMTSCKIAEKSLKTY